MFIAADRAAAISSVLPERPKSRTHLLQRLLWVYASMKLMFDEMHLVEEFVDARGSTREREKEIWPTYAILYLIDFFPFHPNLIKTKIKILNMLMNCVIHKLCTITRSFLTTYGPWPGGSWPYRERSSRSRLLTIVEECRLNEFCVRKLLGLANNDLKMKKRCSQWAFFPA